MLVYDLMWIGSFAGLWRHCCEFGNNVSERRTRAKTVRCSTTQTRLSQLSHIYLWCKQTIKRENYERSRSPRSARPWWLRRCGAATERQSDRAAVVRYKSRTRAQIYDVAASLSLLAASCLYTLGRYGTLSLEMLYSWREWFIAGIFIFCLLHTHTHVHWLHEHCALSLRARERKRAAVSVSNICLRCC